MIYYKSLRLVNGKPKWMLKDENYDIIKSPTKDQIKSALFEEDRPKRCCICGGYESYIDLGTGNPHWYSHKCGKKDCTEYMCHRCSCKNYQKSTDDQNNLLKLTFSFRTGNIDIENSKGEGLIIEAVVAKIRNLKNYNIESDNFNMIFDLCIDSEYGRPEVKGPGLIGGEWNVALGMEHNFDNVWIVCLDKNRKNVKRVYIVPESKLYGETCVHIYEDFYKTLRLSKFEWIEEYRVDEKTKDIYNDTYHNLISFLGNKRYFSIEDIKKWLES